MQLERAHGDVAAKQDQAGQAKTNADNAKVAVENSTVQLKGHATERTKMINQLDQAKLQEQANAAIQQMNEVVNTSDVPSLDAIRSKIEDRYATALGGTELAQDSVQGRMLEVKRATVNMQGAARLQQIRASLGSASAHPALPAGANW